MRPPFLKTRDGLALTLASWLMAAQCFAAPATSDDLSGTPEARTAPIGSTGSSAATNLPVVPAVSQSKSVELLLQLQDQPQQPATEGRAQSAVGRRSAAIASAPQGNAPQGTAVPAEPNPLAHLKNAMLRDAAPRQADTNPGQGPTPGGMERLSNTDAQPLGAQPRREPGQSLLANPVIQYIRENRTTVLTVSVAVLAAIWLTATFSLRRGR